MTKALETFLKVLTLGLYGRNKVKKSVKRYRKDGTLKVDKDVERESAGALSNGPDVEFEGNLNFED